MMMKSSEKYMWRTQAKMPLRLKGIFEIWHYRDLVTGMAWREYLANHRQTLLGVTWLVLKPLLMAVVYWLLLVNILDVKFGQVSPFALWLSGTTIWYFFSDIVTSTAFSVNKNIGVWNKVYYPRLVTPLSALLYVLLVSTGQLLVCFSLLFYLHFQGVVGISWTIIGYTPICLFMLLILGLGIGLMLSILITRYRDFGMMTSLGLRIAFFVTPVLYPIARVPQKWQWLIKANPLSAIFELFRAGCLGTVAPSIGWLAYSLAAMMIILMLGALYFQSQAYKLTEIA